MHAEDCGDTTFNFNGDLSGEVQITRDGVTIKVPAEDLVEFVVNRIKMAAISRIEDFDARRVLKWIWKS